MSKNNIYMPKANYSIGSQQEETPEVTTQRRTSNTIGSAYADIMELSRTDEKSARQAWSMLQQLQTDPNSRYYNQYGTATNRAVSNLQSYGIDTRKLNDKWFEDNDGWIRSNLEYRGRTNTPSAPTKNSTKNQRIAYELYQYQMAEDKTKQAENEYWKAIDTAYYWAQRADRNYTDDEIIGKVRENFAKDYPTLSEMENPDFSPIELNRGVNFSDDVLRGYIWLARNPDQKDVPLETAIAYSYLGEGNQWKANTDISSRLDPSDPNFLPYATGTTNLDEAAMHFGVSGFGKNWLKENDGLQWTGSEEDKKYYEQVRKAEEKTLAAEEALVAINEWAKTKLGKETDPQKAKDEFDKILAKGKVTIGTGKDRRVVDIKILNDMDASIGKNGEPGTGDLIPMTRGVDYKYSNFISQLEENCALNAANGTEDGSKFVDYTQKNWFDNETPNVSTVIKQAQDEKLNGVTDIYEETGTESEQAYVANAWSSSYDDVKATADTAKAQVADNANQVGYNRTVHVIKQEQAGVQKEYASTALPSYQTVYDYEDKQATRAMLQQELETLAPKIEGADAGDIGEHVDTIELNGQQYKVTFAYNQYQYYVKSITDAEGNPVDNNTQFELAYYNDDVNNAIEQYNEQAQQFYRAGNDKGEMTPEEERYRSLKLQINDIDEYLASNEQKYEESMNALDAATKKYDNQYHLMEQYGIDTSDLYVEQVVLGYLTGFSNYDATVWNAYNPSDMYRTALASGEDREAVYAAAEKGNEQVLQELEDAKAVKQYIEDLGADIPKNYIDNLDRHIAKLERDIKDYEYFALSKNDDFEKMAQKGRQEEFDNRPLPWKILKVDQEYGWDYDDYYKHMDEDEADMSGLFAAYGLRGVAGPYARNLTEDEKDTYYYLMGKGEKAKAIDYVKSLIDGTYGVAQTRYMEQYSAELADKFTTEKSMDFNSKEEAEAWVAENGGKDYNITEFGDKYYVSWKEAGGLGNFLGQNALAILASPASSMMSLIYGAYSKISGDEINPNNLMLAFNNFRTKTREESAKEISLVCGEGTIAQKATQMFYEMVTNRLDSLMNSATFGAPSIGGKFGEAASEFVGAMPMGISAAMDAMTKAKRQGASDGQAWQIGAVTFFAETATEAISLENIKNAKGLGEDMTADTVKEFVTNWLTQAGPSEALGESLNDIIEGITDNLVMGEMSEHNNTVWQYRMQGYTKDEAESLALRDEIQGVVRTAFMSYLSPGMDIAQTYTTKATNFINRVSTRHQESEGASIAKVISDMREEKKTAKEAAKAEEQVRSEWLNEDTANGEGAFNLNDAGPMTEEQKIEAEKERIDAEKEKAQGKQNAVTLDYEILETASRSDKSTQTASIASVFDIEGTEESADVANAAAVRIGSIIGDRQTPIEFLQDLLMGASVENVDVDAMKQAVRTGVLGGEDSASYKMMTSPEFQRANPGQKAIMLSTTGYIDQNNNAVNKTIAKNVFENRVAEAQKNLAIDGAMDEVNALQANADDAAIETYIAEQELNDKQEAQKAARDAVVDANNEFIANPSDDNLKMLDRANSALQAADTVFQEYQQHYAKAQQKQEKAEAAVKQTRDEAMAKIRQAAIDIVNQIDARRNGEAEQRQAEAQAVAAQQEEQQKVNDETQSITAMDAEDFIAKNYPDATEEDKQRIREAFQKMQSEMPAEQAQAPQTVDENGNMTPEAIKRRDNFVNRVAKKFGINIVVMDTTNNGTVDRQNGYYDRKNNRIVIDQNASVNDAMFFVLGHELTHVAEQSNTYNALERALLKIRYGVDDARLAADIRAKKALYDERLARMHEQDNTINATPLTEDEAAQEIVADIMGDLLRGDQSLVDQLVAEEPSTARRIVDAIKSFLRRAVGMKGEWRSQAQQTVDMLEKALKDAQPRENNQTQENEQQTTALSEDAYDIRKSYFSDNPVVRFNRYIDQPYINGLENLGMTMFKDGYGWGMRVEKGNKVTEEQIREILSTPIQYSLSEREAVPDATDNGTTLTGSLEDGTEVKYSLSSWTDKEIDTVRRNLLKNGFTEEEANKWISDVNSIAAVIASDKDRLDFMPDPDQKFKKPNGDVYKWTLDASTLCAKRLLYQGTFNAIQEALPNTPLKPGDLIELANMMHEMGYQTPCGICYVESRRRHLGNFTEEFLADYKGEYKPTYAELTSTEGLAKLKQEHRQAYDDYIAAMNGKGVASPKVVQLRTDYRGDVRNLNKDSIAYLNSIGGLRINSFSDFETPHLMDMMQAVIDMAAVKLKSQAYTKVPNFAWVFGDTGIKINLSLMGEGTGVDADGNLIFSNTEGMDFEEAMKLRDRYSKNVGTILVGMNDEHIIAAMGDNRIDYIIPFHKSGWSQEELDRMTTLANYTDYQDTQNELWITGKDKDGKYITKSIDKKTGNLDPYGEEGYWDYNKSGEENAKEYLRICAEQKRLPKFSQFLVDNGDGSFSLPHGDDTRSTNIREGYWKTLVDFKMYENDGYGRNGGKVIGSPQTEVAPNINMEQAYRVLNDYVAPEGGNNALPVANPVVERYVEWYKANHPLDENRVQYSLSPGEEESAVYVKDGHTDNGETVDFIGLMLDGIKKGETRNHNRLTKNWTGLAKDGQVYGRVRFGEPRLMTKYDSDGNITQDYADSMIEGTEYDLKDGESKYFYPVEEIEDFRDNPRAITQNGNYGRYQYSLPSDNLLEQQIRQYIRNGGSLSNQNPNTAPAPRFNQPEKGRVGQRQWGREGAQNSDELFQAAKDHVLNNNLYKKDSNAAELNRALDWIQGNRSEKDPDGYNTSLQRIMTNKNSYRSKDAQARMIAMMALAAAKNDVNAQIDLADAYNKQGTALGQALQARKLFRLMTPEGRVASLRKMISDQQQSLDDRGINVELKLSDWIYQAASYATKEGEFQKVQQAAYEELAKQIPASWKDRLRSWRMLSMLANPRTHIRNIVGNALFIPAVGLKNKLGAIAETIGEKTGKIKEGERTKTLKLVLDKDVRDFARQDAETMKDMLTGEAKFSEVSQIAKSQKKLGKALDWLSEKNSNALEKEDWIFLKGHYRRALGGWMQANGYTASQLKSNAELLEQGRQYAINEAQKATYRDFNKTAQILNQVSRNGGIPGFFVDAALPFKKTPANILKRGIEYSPVGLAKSLTSDMIHMKQYLDYEKGKLNALPEKALSPTQVIDRLCAGLSGTAITALGFLLAGSGVVSCGLDDDDDALKKLNGDQEYSIHLNLFGQDITYTMDWAAPMSMPFFVGAAIREQMEREGGASINEIVNALGNIGEPVFNLSMLDGINSLFKTSQYDDTNAITQILAKIVTNYGTSYVPSSIGAVTRTFFDDTRRKSYVQSGQNTGIEGTLRYAWEQVENKLPGVSTSNIPYRDVWGNAETTGFIERLFENFISPGYVSNVKNDPVVNELGRLYEVTGDPEMIPKEAGKSITVNKVKYQLTAEQYDDYVVARGQAAYNGLNALMQTEAYQRADPELQKEQVKKVWDYANQVGKKAVVPDFKITATGDASEAISDGSVSYYQQKALDCLADGDVDSYSTCVEAYLENGGSERSLKTKVGNMYRDTYKDAYRNGNEALMYDIETLLDDTGLDISYEDWQKAVDNEG